MNLGSFAGSAMQGYQTQERLNMAQAEQKSNIDFRERGMKMREDEASAKKVQRDRDDALRSETMALAEEFPVGGPPENEAKYLAKYSLIHAKHSPMTPEMRQSIADRTTEALKTPFGKSLNKVLGGDQEALAEVVKNMKRDPAGAVLDYRPREGVISIKFPDGEPIDLRRAAAALGTTAYNAELNAGIASAQGEAQRVATTANATAQGNLHNAQAKEIAATAGSKRKLTEAQTNLANSGAGLNAARSRNVGANTASANDAKADKQLLAAVKLLQERDPESADGKGANPLKTSFLFNRASELHQGGKTNPNAAAAAANREWEAVAGPAGVWAAGLSSMPAKERKAKYGSADIQTIKNEAIKRKLGAHAAPSVRSSNLADDGETS